MSELFLIIAIIVIGVVAGKWITVVAGVVTGTIAINLVSGLFIGFVLWFIFGLKETADKEKQNESTTSNSDSDR